MVRLALCALAFLGLAVYAAAQPASLPTAPPGAQLEACRSYNSIMKDARERAEQGLAVADARVRALDAETKALRAELAKLKGEATP